MHLRRLMLSRYDLTRSTTISHHLSFVKVRHQLRQEGPLTRWVGNRCELPVPAVLPLTLLLLHSECVWVGGDSYRFPTHLVKGPSCLSWCRKSRKLRFCEITGDRMRSFLLSISRRGCTLCAVEIPISPGITLNRSDSATQCPAAQ